MRFENGRGLAAVFFLAQKKCLEKERYLSQTYISRHLEIGSSVNKALLSPRKDRKPWQSCDEYERNHSLACSLSPVHGFGAACFRLGARGSRKQLV